MMEEKTTENVGGYYSDEEHFKIIAPIRKCPFCGEVRDLVADSKNGNVLCLGCLEKFEENREVKSGLIKK